MYLVPDQCTHTMLAWGSWSGTWDLPRNISQTKSYIAAWF